LDNERVHDAEFTDSPSLFLPAHGAQSTNGKLSVDAINDIWNEVCEAAGVKGKTPHSARHAMGRHLMDKLQNIAAVQRQLLHKNAAYSVQYSRVTDEELGEAIDERE
jgi:integrase